VSVEERSEADLAKAQTLDADQKIKIALQHEVIRAAGHLGWLKQEASVLDTLLNHSTDED